MKLTINPIKAIKTVKNNYDQKIRVEVIAHMTTEGMLKQHVS